MGSGAPSSAQGEGSSVPLRAKISTNPFEILSTPERLPDPVDEEDEQQATTMEEDKRQEEKGPLQIRTPRGAPSPRYYVDMTRKKST